MAVAMLDRRQFPAVPSTSVDWAAVYLEPMNGSGERLCVLTVAKGHDSEWHIERTIGPKAARCMFGASSEMVMGIVSLIEESLEEHLTFGGELVEWPRPVSNCFLGPVRSAYGEALDVVTRQAARLVSSISTESLGMATKDSISEDSLPEIERWVQQIRESVRRRNDALDSYFNGEVRSSNAASPTRIGFLGDKIAANFDVLIPGSNLSNKRVRSKSRLLDLQILKDQVDLLSRRTSYELMLWLPPEESPMFTPKAIDSARSALAELQEFGDRHELRVREVSAPDEVAEVLVAAEAA